MFHHARMLLLLLPLLLFVSCRNFAVAVLQCSFVEYRNYKVIYRRYASLFFIVGADNTGEEVCEPEQFLPKDYDVCSLIVWVFRV
jgi:hypothetical protein